MSDTLYYAFVVSATVAIVAVYHAGNAVLGLAALIVGA